jgi:hypothetical protein
MMYSHLSALPDDNIQYRLLVVGANHADLLNDVETFDDFTKGHVLAIELT